MRKLPWDEPQNRPTSNEQCLLEVRKAWDLHGKRNCSYFMNKITKIPTVELSSGRTFTYGSTISFSRCTTWTLTIVPRGRKKKHGIKTLTLWSPECLRTQRHSNKILTDVPHACFILRFDNNIKVKLHSFYTQVSSHSFTMFHLWMRELLIISSW